MHSIQAFNCHLRETAQTQMVPRRQKSSGVISIIRGIRITVPAITQSWCQLGYIIGTLSNRRWSRGRGSRIFEIHSALTPYESRFACWVPIEL